MFGKKPEPQQPEPRPPTQEEKNQLIVDALVDEKRQEIEYRMWKFLKE